MNPDLARLIEMLRNPPPPSERVGQRRASYKQASGIRDYLVGLENAYGDAPNLVRRPREMAQMQVPVSNELRQRGVTQPTISHYAMANMGTGARPSNQNIDAYLEAVRLFRESHGRR